MEAHAGEYHSRGIAGFTRQRTAFTREQSTILQSGRTMGTKTFLIHEAYVSKTDPISLLF